MQRKLIFIFFLFFTLLHSATVQTLKEVYTPKESIDVTLKGMLGHQEDWVAIYPIGSSNEWKNVLKWSWMGGISNGTVHFDTLAVGNYEVRIFFKNSFNLEGSYAFSVEGELNDVNLSTTKSSYLPSEEIIVNFKNMLGNPTDWIAIYPLGSSNAWENVLQWRWTKSLTHGTLSFKKLPKGNYEVRGFFKNSFKLEGDSSFVVTEEEKVKNSVSLTLNKNSYAQNELIYINYDNMQGNASDWIAIYPKGSSYHFENVIDYKYTGGNISGEMALGGFPSEKVLHGSTPMPGLAVGSYEIRAFFNNTLHAEKVASFSVVDRAVVSTIYEEANGSISADWKHVSGPYPPIHYNGVARLRAKWIDNHTNTSEYTLVFKTPNSRQNVLELDVGGVGRWTPHFNVGVIVQTTDGQRRMLWDSFLNHYNVSANKQGNVLSYPTYVELQRNTANSRKHFRVNVDKYLKILEPNNKVISISAFFATGGDLDNIKLSSH
jgi:hypothetical protein